ncbi:MAG: TetR family transcriptional regulator [Ilumatobacteraceae bacterium]|nr:TetR family transcriptional regulator [Ilumatobacteraceae bacterium]
MIDATLELLADRPVEHITVREVAERSGHHHRFVAAWFGGKAGLFKAVFEQLVRQLAPTGRMLTESGHIDPRAEQVVQLLNWLVANHPEAFADRAETPLVDAMAAAHVAMGIADDDARLLAQLVLAATVGVILFGNVLGLQPGDAARLYEMQMQMATALRHDSGADARHPVVPDGTPGSA